MDSLPPRNEIPFDYPVTYQIIVEGRIDPTWSDRVEGMLICEATVDADPQVTTLQGELNDQSALAGVLNTLYELHLPVISVMRMDEHRTFRTPIADCHIQELVKEDDLNSIEKDENESISREQLDDLGT